MRLDIVANWKDASMAEILSALAIEVNGDESITNMSINGISKTQHAIFSNGHWFDQLKMSETMAQEKRQILIETVMKVRKRIREIKTMRARLSLLAQRRASICGTSLQKTLEVSELDQEIGDLEDEITAADYERLRLETMFRDCQAEFMAARDARDQIRAENAEELQGKSFETLQIEQGTRALLEKRVQAVTQGLGTTHGLSDALMSVLLELSDQDRELILSIATSRFNQIAGQVQGVMGLPSSSSHELR